MANPSDVEARLAALEGPHGGGGRPSSRRRRDCDLADLGVKVDANRSAINSLGEQTTARFDRLEQRVDNGFAKMRGKLDQTAAGQQQIVELLTGLISGQDDQ